VAALAATTRAQEQAQALAVLPTLAAQGNIYTSTGKAATLETFDQRPDRRGRLTPGAFYEPLATFSTLYNGPLPMPADTGRYEAAVWINAKTAHGNGNMQVKLYDAGGQMLDHLVTDARFATEVQGDWLRVEVPFRRTAQATRIEVLYDSQDLLADDLLIRPLDTDVYSHPAKDKPRRLVKNTYLLAP
jgi:hypothetical protein